MRLHLIRQFCSQDSTRFLMGDLSVDGFSVVATNGRVLVWVPLDEIDEVDRGDLLEMGARKGFPDWRAIARDHWTDDVPTSPPSLEGIWTDHVSESRCDACDGAGSWECPCPECRIGHHVCDDCNGAGTVETWDEWKGRLACGLFASGHYLWKVATLPAVRWFAPREVDASRPVPFAFGESGRGLLMPLRVAPVE